VSDKPSYTCPVCKRTSHNPSDIRERYCGACHRHDPPYPYDDEIVDDAFTIRRLPGPGAGRRVRVTFHQAIEEIDLPADVARRLGRALMDIQQEGER